LTDRVSSLSVENVFALGQTQIVFFQLFPGDVIFAFDLLFDPQLILPGRQLNFLGFIFGFAAGVVAELVGIELCLGEHAPAAGDVEGIDASSTEHGDDQENDKGCKHSATPFCKGVPLGYQYNQRNISAESETLSGGSGHQSRAWIRSMRLRMLIDR